MNNLLENVENLNKNMRQVYFLLPNCMNIVLLEVET